MATGQSNLDAKKLPCKWKAPKSSALILTGEVEVATALLFKTKYQFSACRHPQLSQNQIST
jgi:hypothetical protein